MCACVQPPPYMLGERPTPFHGGSGALSFRQVPFVRVSERVESGIKVRKQLRKYLKTSSTTQHLVAQMHLNDACVPAMQPQEVSQSCFESFLAQMKMYNQVVGQKHLEASKAMLEMSRPLDHSGRSKKWARDVYNTVQKCVQDVQLAEKKMDRLKVRKERADDDLGHWKRVLEANEATYKVQPSNPEVHRAYQLAQQRFVNAFAEQEAATVEFEEVKGFFYAAIERRDQVVEEATELSQSMEEDRMETMLIVMKQFVETKKAILQAEIEAISKMQQILLDMDKESVIQQYIVDAMQPELTHRHAKALYLLEWHRVWHHEQVAVAANEPQDLLALSADEAAKLKSSSGVSGNDLEVVKDFVVSCFVDPERSILTGKVSSTKHRARFTSSTALGLYRLPVVRRLVVQVLHHQRAHSLELSADGFFQLSTALRLLLSACSECDDARTIKSVMNMAQTFYKRKSEDADKEFLLAALDDHPVWSIPQYWGNALLLTVGEELSKNPQGTAWYFMNGQDRMQLVLHIHNLVYGQVASFLYNLQSLGFSRRQIQQYVKNVCFAYELAEDQRISLLRTVDSLGIDDRYSSSRYDEEGDEVQFTSLTLADFTQVPGAVKGGEKLRGFRTRASSGASTDSASSITSTFTNGSTVRDIKDIEQLKQRATVVISSTVSAPKSAPNESWQDLFGSGPPGTPGFDGESRRRSRKSSRKFDDSLRVARSQSMSDRGSGSDDLASVKSAPVSAGASLAQFHAKQPSTPVSKQRQSMDDTSLLLHDERESRRSQQSRVGKARSAATIDTTGMLSDTPPPFMHMAPSPILSIAPSSTKAASTPTGMDHSIKSIAAQMKLRREASDQVDGLTSRASFSSTTSSRHADAPKQLRKSTSSAGNGKSNGGSGDSAVAVDPPLSGVAAMRARFEKK